jgi:hypothetical protein
MSNPLCTKGLDIFIIKFIKALISIISYLFERLGCQLSRGYIVFVENHLKSGSIIFFECIKPTQVKSLDWTARKLKLLKKYAPEDAQIEEINEIIDECLAKIETYLT